MAATSEGDEARAMVQCKEWDERESDDLLDSERTLRQDTSLYVLIDKARHLPKSKIAAGGDIFCSLQLDDHEMSRTMPVAAQEQPNWHEEYHFENCASFGNLVVYMHCRGRTQKEQCMGLVHVNSNILAREPRERELWFPLTSHNRDSIQILLEVLKRPMAGTVSLYVTVLEIRAPPNHCNEYHGSQVFMEVLVGNKKKKTKQRTKTQPWDGSKFAGESQIEFRSLDWVDTETVLCVKVFLKRLLGSSLLGKVTARLSDFPVNQEHLSYYDLLHSSDISPLGALRLKYKYTEDYILPFHMYSTLLELLLRKDFVMIKGLEVAAEERGDLARTLVRLFEGQGLAVKYVLAMCMPDIDKVNDCTRYTLFRSNSLATKAVDMFMKLFGLEYLSSTLKDIIAKIYLEGGCEINVANHPDGEAGVAASLDRIAGYYTAVCNSIFTSASRCPVRIRQFLRQLREATAERLGEDFSLHTICGFLFLRFFCPACLSPKVYGLHSGHPTREVSKVLMHIAKMLQLTSMGSHSTLSDTALESLQPLVDSMKGSMHAFLLEASEVVVDRGRRPVEVDVVVEMAAMHRHMRKCRSRLLAENPKHPTMMALAVVLDDLDRKIAMRMKATSRLSQSEPWKAHAPTQKPRLRSMYQSIACVLGAANTNADSTKGARKQHRKSGWRDSGTITFKEYDECEPVDENNPT